MQTISTVTTSRTQENQLITLKVSELRMEGMLILTKVVKIALEISALMRTKEPRQMQRKALLLTSSKVALTTKEKQLTSLTLEDQRANKTDMLTITKTQLKVDAEVSHRLKQLSIRSAKDLHLRSRATNALLLKLLIHIPSAASKISKANTMNHLYRKTSMVTLLRWKSLHSLSMRRKSCLCLIR